MKLELGFSTSNQFVEMPDTNVIDILYPNDVTILSTGPDEVERSIQNPIGISSVEDLVKGKKNIVIITSDITRPMPSALVLPVLLKHLYRMDIKPENITIVFAVGSHRKHKVEEKRKLVGDEIFDTIRCIDSTECDFVHMGTTSAGTPVDICRVVAEADCRICLGNIEYHYFAGYSGGAKAIMPGVSTRAAIQANHSKMIEPNACTGSLEKNPLRLDLEEALTFCPVDFIINVVLDEHKKIIYSVCGDIIKAHRTGCQFLDKFYKKEIKEKADIVITSQGGAPKDLNLYQTQKALDNAKHAVKDGGIIILVGSCREGLGEATFEEWMLTAKQPSDLIKRIGEQFQLGGHKAAAIAMVQEKADIYLVSELDDELVKQLFMTPFAHVQDALDQAMNKLGQDASVLVMPFGGSTLPHLDN